jgi:hypothetical protein
MFLVSKGFLERVTVTDETVLLVVTLFNPSSVGAYSSVMVVEWISVTW